MAGVVEIERLEDINCPFLKAAALAVRNLVERTDNCVSYERGCLDGCGATAKAEKNKPGVVTLIRTENCTEVVT